MTSYNPAVKFHIKNKGQIKEGFDADLTVVDMDLTAEIEREDLFSKCGWSPYEEKILKAGADRYFVLAKQDPAKLAEEFKKLTNEKKKKI